MNDQLSRDEAAILQAIITKPDDDLPRLALADYIEESDGDLDRAEFIRVQIELARRVEAKEKHHDLRIMRCRAIECQVCILRRHAEFLLGEDNPKGPPKNSVRWSQQVRDFLSAGRGESVIAYDMTEAEESIHHIPERQVGFAFRRGMIEFLYVEPAWWNPVGDEILKTNPIRTISVPKYQGVPRCKTSWVGLQLKVALVGCDAHSVVSVDDEAYIDIVDREIKRLHQQHWPTIEWI